MQNGVLLQTFQWFDSDDGSKWKQIKERAAHWAARGITALWLPPVCKASGGTGDVGYGAYDLWDLGEFDQKGTVRTKYGTKDELLEAIAAAHEVGLQVYIDIVLNHKDGGDETEAFTVQEVAVDDRNHLINGPFEAECFTRFVFPGRQGKYSQFTWSWRHFAWVGHNYRDNSPQQRIYRIKEPIWGDEVDDEQGNSDFLLGCDIDLGDDEVRADLFAWGQWFLETTGCDGFRLDAVKHLKLSFYKDWLAFLREQTGQELPAVGEYYSMDVADLTTYLERTDGAMMLLDIPLHYNLHRASREGASFDLRTLFDNALVSVAPLKAVTFVESHDSQKGGTLECNVEDWFKPHAYAAILLREGGYPCVFLADYDGFFDRIASHQFLIDAFLDARRRFGFGAQEDYFQSPDAIGWVRLGDEEHPGAMAVVLSNGAADPSIQMNLGRPGATFVDATGHKKETLTADAEGKLAFSCPAGKVSVWLQQ